MIGYDVTLRAQLVILVRHETNMFDVGKLSAN